MFFSKMKCQGITKSGKRCKNKAGKSGYCRFHIKQEHNKAAPKILPTIYGKELKKKSKMEYSVDITEKLGAYHNPIISEEFPQIWKSDGNIKIENLIPKLHFIWIGSELNNSNSKNVPKWVKENQGCNYNIYIWYDSHFFDSIDPIVSMLKYIKTLNKLSKDNSLYLCDIRNYPIMELKLAKNILKAYEYEVGLKVRPKMPKYTREIRNWGMGSDILRILILYLYGGFYMDVDMEPTKLCDLEPFINPYEIDGNKYYIKTCKNSICMSWTVDDEYINNGLYYHPDGRLKGWYKIDDNGEIDDMDYMDYLDLYYKDSYDPDNAIDANDNIEVMEMFFEKSWARYKSIMKNYYYYILYNYYNDTLDTFGPGMLLNYFNGRLRFNRFHEDLENHSSSWTHKRDVRLILVRLLTDLIKDIKMVKDTNRLLRTGSSSITELINAFVGEIDKYILIGTRRYKSIEPILIGMIFESFKERKNVFSNDEFWERLYPIFIDTLDQYESFIIERRSNLLVIDQGQDQFIEDFEEKLKTLINEI